MKVAIISHTDLGGGAALAAFRLHKSLRSTEIDSTMFVRSKSSDDWNVFASTKRIEKVFNKLRTRCGISFNSFLQGRSVTYYSGNWIPSRWASMINQCDSDLVNLHWVGCETLSIEDLGRITKPIIWTMHDMWPFCGAEHLASDMRWRDGYASNNRPAGSKGPDFEKFVWLRKRRAWKQAMHIVSPSNWLADCARNSMLFSRHPVSVIPNPVYVDTFKPLDQAFCRSALNLPTDKHIVLFGAVGGSRDRNKGFDLLEQALGQLAGIISPDNLVCVVFGQSEPQQPCNLPYEVRWMGHLHDETTLALLYNAASVVIVPSRLENLPQTATEAQSCGCPVVAFDTGGLSDAVAHRDSGYLAKAYDVEDLAYGIYWVLEEQAAGNLKRFARDRAVRLWSPHTVAAKYASLYSQLLAQHSELPNPY